ncbi:fumarylacetoacetate hydrolase family protein [Histidinibacterium aquaticum]|uniref:Fumarylacetoacetate hydrolase family protein n=1 Tax=Histidinibacterium aquaticum TaxID=2613962 RepID=A0A5J5GM31_9RHOB|nr:fumarylacetoacetate hydrolase family protein [Histidinibacterium aquaticum]KAA9009351.1 fumarylacetoacetate hydrolase family protein [Histidinibacterium aquaticum]
MTEYIFEPEPPAALPVLRIGALYAVRRIFCIGRNYAAHAAEMGNRVTEAPWFFTKSVKALARSGAVLAYPKGTADYHHEVELVAALGEGGAVWGWATGLDMTRRDLQAQAKEGRLPWDAAKDVEGGAVIGPLTPATDWAPAEQEITLEVGGERRQRGRVSEMIHPVDRCLAHLAGLYDLGPGDLVMTGTPSGVGAVGPGDRLLGRIEGLAPVELELRA